MHAHGLGVAKDRNEALRWYRKAAAQGHPGARVNMSVLERGGTGIRWLWWAGAILFALLVAAILLRR